MSIPLPSTAIALVVLGSAFHLISPISAQELPAPLGWSRAANVAGFSSDTLDRLHSPLLRSDLQLQGAQSCAAASCHGGPRPGVAQPWVSRGSEYSLWIERDPHARSWRTISSEQSVAMMTRLKIMRGGEIIDREGFDNCLACHNTTKRFHEPRSQEERHEGVGCAGCHGPEEHWKATHYQYGFDPHAGTDVGFVANGDLLTRARACASCHVGDQDRDMNHDIIAAGHPALRYELATFHSQQPKHWRDAEADDRTFYEAQLWLAGQIAAADASLSLLEARANQAHSVSEWPELSAYDCSSCHHSLGLKNARRTPNPESQQAVATYSTWNMAGLLWVIRYRIEQGEATPEDRRLAAALQQVSAVMETQPRPDAMRAAATAAEARRAIAAWVDGTAGHFEFNTFRSDRLGRVAASAAGKARSFDTWESAVQLYLAAVAARESWPGGTSGALHDTAESLRRGLAYPQHTSSPDYALRQRVGAPATRDEVRRMTLELTRWLGPIVVDQEKLPGAGEPSAEQLQREIADLLEQSGVPGASGTLRSSPVAPGRPLVPTQPQASPERTVKPPTIAPPATVPAPRAPAPPAPTQTLEELRKQLESLQGDSDDE
ncbi:MAG: multiheme c-type cytochrome [Planctomycetaceae bacterium]